MFLPAALHLDLAGDPPLPSRRGESPARSPQINPKAGFINSMTPTCVHQQRQEFNADCIFCREIQQKEAEENARDNHDQSGAPPPGRRFSGTRSPRFPTLPKPTSSERSWSPPTSSGLHRTGTPEHLCHLLRYAPRHSPRWIWSAPGLSLRRLP